MFRIIIEFDESGVKLFNSFNKETLFNSVKGIFTKTQFSKPVRPDSIKAMFSADTRRINSKAKYDDKRCINESCNKLFTPAGPRSIYCPECLLERIEQRKIDKKIKISKWTESGGPKYAEIPNPGSVADPEELSENNNQSAPQISSPVNLTPEKRSFHSQNVMPVKKKETEYKEVIFIPELKAHFFVNKFMTDQQKEEYIRDKIAKYKRIQ